jgi:hypothetical protein
MNSECNEHQKNLPALLLGELAPKEKEKLEAHLATCSYCRSERESYAGTIQHLGSVGSEPVPHHFFVYAEEQAPNPWKLFRRMPLRWQAALAFAAMLMFMVGVAAISQLQIQSNSGGWTISFGRTDLDLAALKKDLLDAAEKRNLEARSAWIQDVQNDISHSYDRLSQQQQAQIADALIRMDSRVTGRITNSEGQVRDDTRKLVSDLYHVISQERAQDLEAVNLRFESSDANEAIKTRQQNEILGTLLQVADLRLK